ncbi:ANTAR domain-containing response regulator [Viridibacterium curvum]|uniref:Response regulator n=1 Tax=Viridibacterium curvum TaxID=1101404 RepID=A0ABP9QYP7_9RHOO
MSGCIAIAEDDPIQQDVLSTTLESAGYTTLTFSNAESLIARLDSATQQPDLALLDIGLPGMSGLAAADWIQNNTAVPCIVITGDDQAASVEQAISAGAFAYIVKPLDADHLMPQIRTVMARHAEQRQLQSRRTQLELALQTDRGVSVAIGILMHALQIDEAAAFERLRAKARASRTPIATLAQAIVERRTP